MEKTKIIIKGSFRGIAANFTKNILVLLINLVIYLGCNTYKNKINDKNQIDSFFSALLNFDKLDVVAILAVIYLIIIIVAIISISILLNTFSLIYNLGRVTTFDFTTGKINMQYYSLPFNKTTDENKFNEVINVNIEQGIIQRLFNTGNMYIEYLTYTTVDSQLRHIEIPCVTMPFLQKNKIM